MSSMMWC